MPFREPPARGPACPLQGSPHDDSDGGQARWGIKASHFAAVGTGTGHTPEAAGSQISFSSEQPRLFPFLWHRCWSP